LVPFWTKPHNAAKPPYNACAENIRTAPAYRGPFKTWQSLVPTSA